LCHTGVLWAEEDLPLAAARQLLFGKVLYRDIWFDKPPLIPFVYLLWGAKIGFVLRIAGAVYTALCAWLAWLLARSLWTDREGRWAGILMAFFLTFDTPSAVLPIAADLLLLAPHLAAIWLTVRGSAFWGGIAAGIGFLANTKALFVLASCAIFAGTAVPVLAVGFVFPCALAAIGLLVTGAWDSYVDQVWVWSSAYAKSTFVDRPLINGLVRTANWSGFHLALLVPSGFVLTKDSRRWKLAAWALLSFAGVALGWRFFPRYYFQILPVAVLAASRGISLMGRRWWIPLILLLIPLARFGPRYPMLAVGADSHWADIAMDRESREAAGIINALKKRGDTLYVWGYRPDLYPYTGLRAASRYLDCQAMTGVPADRHLTQSGSVLDPSVTAAARRELVRSQPVFIVDGLSKYNPRLALAGYPETQEWLRDYREIAEVRGMIVYRRR